MRLKVPPQLYAAQYRQGSRRYDTFAVADELGKQTFVLRVLIEDFGGEATGASLCGRIVGQSTAVMWNETQVRGEIRAVLGQLGKCGALAIESLGGSEVVARITRQGAMLAYKKPTAEAGPGST